MIYTFARHPYPLYVLKGTYISHISRITSHLFLVFHRADPRSLCPRGGSDVLVIFCNPYPLYCIYSLEEADFLSQGTRYIFLTIEGADSIPRGVHLKFALEILIPPQGAWFQGPDSLPEVPLPSGLIPPWGVFSFKSWLQVWGAFIFEVLIPFSNSLCPLGPDSFLRCPSPRGLLSFVETDIDLAHLHSLF